MVVGGGFVNIVLSVGGVWRVYIVSRYLYVLGGARTFDEDRLIKGQAGQIVRCLCIHGITRVSRSKQPRFICGIRGHASATTPECRKQFEYHPSPHARAKCDAICMRVLLPHIV